MKTQIKQDKGVAGLTVLLSVVVFLFMIGLMVFLFSLMGGELKDATYTSTTLLTTGENHTRAELIAGSDLAGASYRNPVCSINAVTNQSLAGTVLSSGNYTLTACALANATVLDTATSGWIINYTVVYDADNSATDVMNDTTTSISGTTDWFALFIVITALVVLILLTVIIITAIKGSGLLGGGSKEAGA